MLTIIRIGKRGWKRNTGDMRNATKYLALKGVETYAEIKQIPENMHWITDPAGTVFIVKKREE